MATVKIDQALLTQSINYLAGRDGTNPIGKEEIAAASRASRRPLWNTFAGTVVGVVGSTVTTLSGLVVAQLFDPEMKARLLGNDEYPCTTCQTAFSYGLLGRITKAASDYITLPGFPYCKNETPAVCRALSVAEGMLQTAVAHPIATGTAAVASLLLCDLAYLYRRHRLEKEGKQALSDLLTHKFAAIGRQLTAKARSPQFAKEILKRQVDTHLQVAALTESSFTHAEVQRVTRPLFDAAWRWIQ